MNFSSQEIASLVNGRVEGNPATVISHPASIKDAGTGSISFIANKKYLEFVNSTKASVLLLSDGINIQNENVKSIIRVDDPYSAFAIVMQKFSTQLADQTGIEQPSFISPKTKIGKEVFIGAFSYISNDVVIEDGVKIFPNTFIGERCIIKSGTIIYSGVNIYAESVIGKNCIIHSGVVIGSDGFGHAPLPDGSYMKIPQLGNVVIEDEVEIGANTTIDRAALGSTIIRRGAKLDNLIQIAHNVEVGENTVIAAQAGISGSTRIGKQNLIGGQAGIVGHISTANGTRINAQSGVSKSVTEKNKAITGSPAFDYTSALRSQAIFKQLPELQKKILSLEKEIEELKNQK